eukprot:m.141470 g.141470  ORF g.141470 m.141470 type:complete len:365 (+) comp17116_c0_seq1:178-1272(+)
MTEPTVPAAAAAAVAPQPRGRHRCEVCGKGFPHPSKLERHKLSHTKAKDFPCTHPDCGKRFRQQEHLRTHHRTQHEHQYRHCCIACGKGFESQRKFRDHQQLHDIESVKPTVAARLLHEQAQELRTRLFEATKVLGDKCTTEACNVPKKHHSDPSKVFLCGGSCKRRLHWRCVGYDYNELGGSKLPVVVCPRCLHAQGRSVTSCSAALAQRQLLQSVVSELKGTVRVMPADGWCLLKAVACGVCREGEHRQLLQDALHAVPDLEIPDAQERVAVLTECQAMLNLPPRKLEKRWDSTLFDYIPLALARAIERPIHVLEAASGEVKRHVCMPLGGPEARKPAVTVLRSWSELGLAHYDLVKFPGTS